MTSDSTTQTNWPNVLFYIYLHLSAFYGLFLIFTKAYLATTLLAVLVCVISSYGITMGAHRLWAHASFKASTSLRVLLCFLHTICAQGSIYDWVVEHRVHHEIKGTILDPFNPNRGFLYAHINNRFKKSNPQLEELKKKINMSDIEQDAIVMFQKRFYWVLMPVLNMLLIVNTPVEFWGEDMLTSLCVVRLLPHVVLLNLASLIHSGPLIWGHKAGQSEADSNLIFLVRKSRWPDYHYMLPWDYKTGEFGCYGTDFVTHLIEIAFRYGYASELRTCSDDAMTRALEMTMDDKINLSLQESIEKVIESDKLLHAE